MAGYGVKQAIQEARIAKGNKHAERNTCGDCGSPARGTDTLCKDCRADAAQVLYNVELHG